jgi:small GTP-binding protein
VVLLFCFLKFTMSYQICVIGEGGVGKSAITVQFIHSDFVEEYDPTIEDSFRKQIHVDHEVCHIDIVDTAGQEEYSCLRNQHMRGMDGFLLVYSITSRSSFEGMTSFYNQVLLANDDSPAPLVIAGNKADIEHKRQVSPAEGAARAQIWGCPYIETSAKTRTNIDEAFFEVVREIRRFQNKNKKREKKHKNCTLL